ncbi:hypothetical protein H1R17_03900 [Flavobacterium sp. xlx-214]|uniref:hypothetical protein n=1 Tax=unclassified Flavobacterium TaxID=196869 RepID=UPI0013D52AAB|nr:MULTISPECIES: hypothetical protein [unclassified Flavobacterium]MBA5792035.1 hypothetical protein [Flavobacterium sp. xlx-221]QMI84287.1 hypothetical protein H1R17_03900 [Flavobacterium sp. xlx-214]
MLSLKEIRTQLNQATVIPDEIIQHIYKERWLQIWVPKQYKGLGFGFNKGLQLLKELAATDGSLGWMVTLCAGANYFSRNLKPKIAQLLFKDDFTCFGGSGMIGGTAEKQGDNYLISGFWKYATGAPHLSHFTLNAVVTENDIPVLDGDGKEQIRSFIIPKNQVKIIADWKSMGMKATGTFSFTVDAVLVSEDYSFTYNTFYTESILDKIPFRIFADLTLLINYMGMAQHFCKQALLINPDLKIEFFNNEVEIMTTKMFEFAHKVETYLLENNSDLETLQTDIHQFGVEKVTYLAHEILNFYMQLGIVASNENQPINQIFKDFFTATQHANFRRKE